MSALYLISGMVGAGKTTLARQMAAETGALRLSPDDGIKGRARNPQDRREADALRPEVELEQWETASEALRGGKDVICENGFWFREERLERLSAARRLGARVELHFLDASIELLLSRVAARNRDPRNSSFQVDPGEVRRWFARLEVPDADECRRYDLCRIYRQDTD